MKLQNLQKGIKFVLSASMSTLLIACSPSNDANNAAMNTDATGSATAMDNTPTETVTAGENQVILHTAVGDVAVDKHPNPLAVYDMTAMQNLTALGVYTQGLPTLYEHTILGSHLVLPDAPEAVNIGAIKEPNLESLHALNPKAVFIGSRQADKYDALSQAFPTYNLTMDETNVYESSKQQLADFGRMFDKEAEAAKLQSDIDAAIEQVRTQIPNKGTALAVLINGDKISAYGENSRFGFLHKAFGFGVADSNIEEARHGQPVSFEYIQKLDPDWLFVLDRTRAIGEEGESAKAILDNAIMHGTKAYKNNHIVYLSDDAYLAFGGYYQWLEDARRVLDAAAVAQ